MKLFNFESTALEKKYIKESKRRFNDIIRNLYKPILKAKIISINVIDKLTKDFTNTLKKTINGINKGNFVKRSSSLIKEIKIIKEKIVKSIVPKTGSTDKEMTTEGFIEAWTIWLAMVIANTAIAITFASLWGVAGYMIFVCIFGPIVEEYAKKVSISRGVWKTFFGIFNVFEFTSYVLKYWVIFGPRVLYIRAVVVLMHFVTTIIQKHFKGVSIKTKDSAWDRFGFVIGCMIHILWNMFGGLLIV